MKQLSVLLVTGVVTREHDWRLANELLRTLLESTGRFFVRVTEAFDGATATTLSPYDVILLNYDGRNFPSDPAYARWCPETEQAFFGFVARGGGVAIYHSSVWLDEALPEEYRRLRGLYCTTPAGGRRSPKGDFAMELTDEPHPITAGLPKTCAIINDDLFAGAARYPGAKVRVLAGVLDALEDYQVPGFPPPHHPVMIPGGELQNMPGVNTLQPVCWVNTYEQGRAFVMTLGHAMETLRRVPYMTMLCRGVEWAATGEVTIYPPDRSGENRLKPWPYY